MKQTLARDEGLSLGMLAGLVVLLLVRSTSPFVVWTVPGVVLLAITAVARPASRRELILLGFLLPVSLVLVDFGNMAVVSLNRSVIDPILSDLEDGVSVSIYRWVLLHRWCDMALKAIYYGLPLFAAFVFSVSPRRMACVRAWALAAILAPIFYVAFPAVGPAHVGIPYAPRNCIPSLHLTWALLCVVYVAPRWRWTAISFAVLTAAATLGTGEHYVIDLVVAAPYAWGITWLEEARGKWAAGWSRKGKPVVAEGVPGTASEAAIAAGQNFPVN